MSEILYSAQLKYLEELRAKPDGLILQMEEFAKANRIPILDWKAAELMETLIMIHRPKRVLEIGTAIAYSTIRIARKLKKKSSIDTIEKSKDNIKLATENIKKAGLEEIINLIEGDALNIMPALEKKYDFIFLDADKEDYLALFEHAMKLLKKNGVLFVDNLLWHGYAASNEVPEKYKTSTKFIRDFNKVFMNHPQLKTTLVPVGDGIGLGIRIK